jgi:hypothetical protein
LRIFRGSRRGGRYGSVVAILADDHGDFAARNFTAMPPDLLVKSMITDLAWLAIKQIGGIECDPATRGAGTTDKKSCSFNQDYQRK